MSDDALTSALHGLIDRSGTSFGMLVLKVRSENIVPLVERLRGEHGFELFLDVTAVDHPSRSPRFDVVYHFYSRKLNRRVRVKTAVSEEWPIVPTLTALYGSARYMERELHDMYGIVADGNDDLRPILLYEGFTGHPLRKAYAMDAEQPIVPYRE
jgi:NADH-quinone oxidoreductase subunit C